MFFNFFLLIYKTIQISSILYFLSRNTHAFFLACYYFINLIIASLRALRMFLCNFYIYFSSVIFCLIVCKLIDLSDF